MIQEFNLQRKAFKTVASLRFPPKMSLIYREVHILLSLVNNVFGRLLVPTQTLVTQFVMFITALLACLHNNYSDRIENYLKVLIGVWMITVPWWDFYINNSRVYALAR